MSGQKPKIRAMGEPGRPNEWPVDVRERVVHEVLEGGCSVLGTVNALADGRLEGVPAMPVPRTTAQRWVDAERRKRAAEEPIEPSDLEKTAARLYRMHIEDLDELERLQRTPKRRYPDQLRLERGMKVAIARQQQLQALLGRPKQPAVARTPKDGDQAPEPKTEEEAFLDQLREPEAEPIPSPEPTEPGEEESDDA